MPSYDCKCCLHQGTGNVCTCGELIDGAESKPLFYFGDVVKHKATGALYDIVDIPVNNERLEYCNEPYYIYRCRQTGIEWVRRQSEMEDGRFYLLV